MSRRIGPRRASGFTLIELLVVIGIIALLLSILLPVLGQMKRKAQATACSSQGRQIYMAMIMFSHDNKGHLPRAYGVGDLSSDVQMVKTFAYLQKVGGASGHIDLDDDKGALWKYMKGKETRAKVMMCPGDDGEPLAGHPINAAYPRNFSYSLNHLIERGGPNTALGIKITKVQQSSLRIMVYEELAPNDAWCIMGQSSDDVPSGRHGSNMKSAYRGNPNSAEYKSKGRGCFTFFDGHVESLSPDDLLPPRGKASYHFPLMLGDRTMW